MEMTGERRIPAPRERVWEALNDPEVLRASIPGCESVERTADDQFQARVSIKLGPMAARFAGKVTLTNINPPESYTITGEGQGGAMGFAKGGADVALEALGPSETLLKYAVKAQVGGKMAQLGARLIDSTAKSMSDQFFDRFAAQLTPPQPVEQPAAPAPVETAPTAGAIDMAQHTAAPVSGTDTEYLKEPGAPAPRTQHGAEGMSAGGPVERPGGQGTPLGLPLRLLTQDFMGMPAQFWIGAVLMLGILTLLFVVG